MSVDDHKRLVRRWFEELWNQGNAAVADEIIAPNYTVQDPGTPGRTGGIAGEQQAVAMYRTVFPDLHFTIEDLVAEGDRCVARWTARGTQLAPLPGIPPTGTQVTVTGISFSRLANGRIVEHWLNWDTLGMLQQLGAIPAPGQAGEG